MLLVADCDDVWLMLGDTLGVLVMDGVPEELRVPLWVAVMVTLGVVDPLGDIVWLLVGCTLRV